MKWLIGGGGVVVVVAIAGAFTLRVMRPVVSVTKVVEGPVVQAFYATGDALAGS